MVIALLNEKLSEPLDLSQWEDMIRITPKQVRSLGLDFVANSDEAEYAALQANLALEDVRLDAVYGGPSTTVAMFKLPLWLFDCLRHQQFYQARLVRSRNKLINSMRCKDVESRRVDTTIHLDQTGTKHC